jgi:hypothetical protein
MNQELQKNLVSALCDNLKGRLLEILETGDVPDEWNGIELRRWVGDYYDTNFKDVGTLEGKRKKEYRNTLIVKNLI